VSVNINLMKDKILRRLALYKHFNSSNQLSVNNFPFLTRKEIDELKLAKLKFILNNAINTVPFYKNLKIELDIINFSLNELKKFPVINKELIQKNPKLFLSTTKCGFVSQTSGSTGEPFKYYLPYRSHALELLIVNRAWGMGEIDYKFKDPIVNIRSYSPKDGEPLTKHDRNSNYYYISAFHLNNTNLAHYIDFIINSKAKILRGYPSSIYIFTLLLKESKIKLDQIKSIITSSETLLPFWRNKIEDYWDLKILDWYGQNERTVTVQQCWAGNYHNNDDYGIIEIDEENSIIATSLNNDVMPFIRYNTNDKAIPLKENIEKCICGRNTSIPFIGIEGRKDDILIKTDGTLVSTANFSTALKNFSKLKQFQVIQEDNRSLILNLVIDKNIDSSYIDKVKTEFFQRLGQIDIKVVIKDEIERDSKTGKLKVVIQKGKI
jgi:phenylacetate-CoA ligase